MKIKESVSPTELRHYQNLKKLPLLYGLNKYIDQFVDNRIRKQGSYDHINIEELVYNPGDSLIIKGKIENGQIVPLY